MALTSAQYAIVAADIAANGDLNSQQNTPDGSFEIARLYNLEASPVYTVWKTSVSLSQLMDAFDGAELSSLTTAESNRLQVIAAYSFDGVNPSLPDRRDLFDDIFSGAGGNVTRPNLLALYKRLATRLEALLAIGAGSDADPSVLTFQGQVAYTAIHAARNS